MQSVLTMSCIKTQGNITRRYLKCEIIILKFNFSKLKAINQQTLIDQTSIKPNLT